ncbi:metallophosphoesterase [Haloferax sp. YSSS75]|uniref:metallophosphoesterase n=1 Tax=Haloferax sp. YSSS75 TaxID=3388564 RepID=UPI00398D66D4
MNIGHLADIHLGHRQYGLNQREDDMTSTFKATLQLIMQDDPDAILLPGDLFHSRVLRPKVLEAAQKGLSVVPDDVLEIDRLPDLVRPVVNQEEYISHQTTISQYESDS